MHKNGFANGALLKTPLGSFQHLFKPPRCISGAHGVKTWTPILKVWLRGWL